MERLPRLRGAWALLLLLLVRFMGAGERKVLKLTPLWHSQQTGAQSEICGYKMQWLHSVQICVNGGHYVRFHRF